MNCYVYIYLDPRKSGKYVYGNYCFLYEPFYVGKGKGRRLNTTSGRNKYFENKINRIEESGLKSIVIKIHKNLSEDDSFILESKLINIIGRKDLNKGPLINFTDGGEGISGYIHNDKSKKKISIKLRKKFRTIQEEFEKYRYVLLTKKEEYKNARTRLNYICPNNHLFHTTWYSFYQGNRCRICGYNITSKILRKDFDDIQKVFKKERYILLTKEEEYNNAQSKLKYICQFGHKHSITWGNFQQGNRCPYCKKLKINFSDIYNEFSRREYILLTKEKDYINSKIKLDYICPNGHFHSMSWSNFKQGRSCPICYKRR